MSEADILTFEDIYLNKTFSYADYLKREYDELLELIKSFSMCLDEF